MSFGTSARGQRVPLQSGVNGLNGVNGAETTETKKTFKDFWVYVVGALVVGLMIPDNMNPYNIIVGLFKKKDDKQTTDKNANSGK